MSLPAESSPFQPFPETLALATADVLECTPILRGSNRVFLVDLGLPQSPWFRAIYKPALGESPLYDFPDGSLYLREFLAYRVSEALGWGLVPPTVIRDGPHGVGSVQLFIGPSAPLTYFDLLPNHREHLRRIAIFDCLVNNSDRKAGHFLQDSSGRIWIIDHGLTFHATNKLRTVMWDLASDPIPPDILSTLRTLRGKSPRASSLKRSLLDHLSPAEVRAFYQRLTLLLESATIPMRTLADPNRPYPWPLV